MWDEIANDIARAIGSDFAIEHRELAGGGCINETCVVSGQGQVFFVKTNSASSIDMFRAEAKGLEEMARTGTIRVPRPICQGCYDQQAFLVLEYLDLVAPRDKDCWWQLGKNLAHLHRITSASFGWTLDNTIGSTPQPNAMSEDWVGFFREKRLEHQLRLARDRGRIFEDSDTLLDGLGEFFHDYTPVPSLIHGDLWNGNVSFLKSGEPVVYDPALYYADREAEFGIIDMFGGFAPEFYEAYNSEWPLDPGFGARKGLYLLYHQLNHFNLFGTSYASSCQATLNKLLKHIL